MAVTVTCTKAELEPGTGRLLCEFSDGAGMAFDSVAAAQDAIRELDTQPTQGRLLLLAWWLARDGNANNPNLVTGKSLTFDLSAANPIRIQ